MTTTISNPATFSSVRNAFNTQQYGISNSFKEYRMGLLTNGPIVPYFLNEDVYGIGQATESDPLRLSQFNGLILPYNPFIITINNVEVSNDRDIPTASFYRLEPNRNIYISTSVYPYYALLGQWKIPATASSAYQGRMTKTNVTDLVSVGAALDTWHNLGTTTEWAFETSERDALQRRQTCSLDIRLASTGEVLATASVIGFNWRFGDE